MRWHTRRAHTLLIADTTQCCTTTVKLDVNHQIIQYKGTTSQPNTLAVQHQGQTSHQPTATNNTRRDTSMSNKRHTPRMHNRKKVQVGGHPLPCRKKSRTMHTDQRATTMDSRCRQRMPIRYADAPRMQAEKTYRHSPHAHRRQRDSSVEVPPVL